MGQDALVLEVVGEEQRLTALNMQLGPKALQWSLVGIAHVAGSQQIHGMECYLMHSSECMQVRGAEDKTFGGMVLLAK